MDTNVMLRWIEMCKLDGRKVNIYLINGIKLTGTISDFDDVCLKVLPVNGTGEQLIYQHAISTIVKT